MLILLALGSMVLAGCGGGASSSVAPSSVVPSSSQPASSSEAPKSSSPAPSSSVKPSSSSQDPIAHKDPYVKAAPEGAVVREYNEKFDLMVDDFTSENLKGTLVGERNPGNLRVLVDSQNEDFPKSEDASIYKTAAAEFDSTKPDVVGFKIRKLGEGNLKTENLIFACRGNDAVAVYEINLADAFDSDNLPLPELTNEYQDIEVDFGNTIEDDNTVYMNKDGTPSTVKVLETMIGFHLYAQDVELSQEIEIAEVYTITGTTKKVIDCFDHDATNKNPTFGPYWVDSTGFIVRRGINIDDGSYTIALPEEADDYENVVIAMQGENSGLTVNGKTCKDLEGNAIKEAVDGTFVNYVVNFEKSGIEPGEELVIASSEDLNISKIFLTNMQEKEAAKGYPVVDIENRAIFDSFNRKQDEFTDNWDIASTADYTPDPISVALSYSNQACASVHDGYLDIKQPESGYVQVKEACDVALGDYQYLVIVANGNLEGFRLGSSDVIWSHDWVAGAGLKSIPANLEEYEYYHAESGFAHYIIDLTEIANDIGKDAFLDMYFNNAIKIDEIYFTNKACKHIEDGLGKIGEVADLSGYAYVGWIYLGDAYRLDLTFTGTGSLKSFRFEDEDKAEFWFKDNKVIGIDGEPISKDLEFAPDEPLTISIDVLASGFKGNVHLHSGAFDGSTGNARVDAKRFYTSQWRKIGTMDEVTLKLDNEYTYCGGAAVQIEGYSRIELLIHADAEGLDLQTARIEGAEVKYANAQGLIDPDGEVIDHTTAVPSGADEWLSVMIDIAKTFGDITPYKDDGYLHIHWGSWGSAGVTGKMKANFFAPFTAAYEMSLYYAVV